MKVFIFCGEMSCISFLEYPSNLITLFEKSWKKWSGTYQFYPLNNNNNIIYLEFKEIYTWIIPLVLTQGRVHIFYVLCCKVM